MINFLHVQFGCLSSRYFYKQLQDIYTSVGKHTKPPVSLVGQVSSKFTHIFNGLILDLCQVSWSGSCKEIGSGSSHVLCMSGFDVFSQKN
jgi:hypothetical protein